MGRLIDAGKLQKQFSEKSTNPNYRVNMHNIKAIINNAPTVEAIPKAKYEERLKSEREKIAEKVANKMNYMGSCLNEKNIILGIIRGKRETLDSLCTICKSESCVSNHTALSKSDYEARLKADMVAMLEELKKEFEEYEPKWAETEEQAAASCRTWDDFDDMIQQKINTLEEKINGN